MCTTASCGVFSPPEVAHTAEDPEVPRVVHGLDHGEAYFNSINIHSVSSNVLRQFSVQGTMQSR